MAFGPILRVPPVQAFVLELMNHLMPEVTSPARPRWRSAFFVFVWRPTTRGEARLHEIPGFTALYRNEQQPGAIPRGIYSSQDRAHLAIPIDVGGDDLGRVVPLNEDVKRGNARKTEDRYDSSVFR
jgi:hypothetical protein